MNDLPSIPDSESDERIWKEAAEQPDDRPGIPELREELAAATAEWRRGTRRSMEVMKEFGAALTAMSEMLRDVHTAARPPVSQSPAVGSGLTDEWLTTLIDLSDRMARTAAAFDKAPPQNKSWWPGSRAAQAAWRNAWATQREAFHILQQHTDSLLVRAGLQRLACAGSEFNPATMTAVEVITDAGVPDHTVTAELLCGWRHSATQKVIRPAQVRVSRRPA